MDALDAAIPRGMGGGAVWRLRVAGQLDEILLGGVGYAVGQGHGVPGDLEYCEDRGRCPAPTRRG